MVSENINLDNDFHRRPRLGMLATIPTPKGDRFFGSLLRTFDVLKTSLVSR